MCVVLSYFLLFNFLNAFEQDNKLTAERQRNSFGLHKNISWLIEWLIDWLIDGVCRLTERRTELWSTT